MYKLLLSFSLVAIAQYCYSQTLTESNLPILVIESSDEITAEGRVDATMKIYWKEDGSINRLTDLPENYDGNIGIKFRGQSSLIAYPKKGYSIETRDELGEDDAVKLLGMPKETDWVLHGPYADKSLMRNALLYTLADEITPYSPRVQMVEMILDNEYQGVYLFTEKIKRDGDRVDIANLKDDELTGDDLTGGYILKFDKSEIDEIGWASSYASDNGKEVNFVHVYPDWDEIAPEQKEYIKDWMDTFEDVLNGPDFADPLLGYRKKINTGSFIDFILLNEMSRNVDGYRLSTYMYKDKDSNDDELYIGPVWDYNFAFGNANYCNGSRIEGWAYDFNSICPDDSFPVHFWWKKLLEDPTFVEDLKEKWMKLRNDKYSNANLTALIDKLEASLEVPATRNFQRWDGLGEFVWPNDFIGDTYKSEVDYLRQWLADRLAWMDQQFDIQLSTENSELSKSITLSPNPANDFIQIQGNLDNEFLVKITNNAGGIMISQSMKLSDKLSVANFPSGVYQIQIYNKKEVIVKRFVKM